MTIGEVANKISSLRILKSHTHNSVVYHTELLVTLLSKLNLYQT